MKKVIECYGCDNPVKREGDVCRLCREELGMSHVPPAMRAPNRYDERDR
jgi:predicted amidophosphoribosyltransferase